MAVGKTLKETREEKGITIEEASKETKIRKKYILALENDEFNKITGQVYQKAFLKTYADFLGLDQDNILEEYQLDQQISGVEEESLGRSKRRSKKNKKATFFNLVSRITGKAMIIILIILLLGGIVGYNLIIMDSNNGNNNLIETEEVEQPVEDEGENGDDLIGDLNLDSDANRESDNSSDGTETEDNSDNLLETGIDPTDLSNESIQLG
ncbi:MAG: helix-turn-helix domain-containing protein, partial [Halarsenatibacteraceae bacterium]